MADVAKNGKKAARHLRGQVWEVRAEGANVIYRLLFAAEGRYSQVLLGLVFFVDRAGGAAPCRLAVTCFAEIEGLTPIAFMV